VAGVEENAETVDLLGLPAQRPLGDALEPAQPRLLASTS
jgi:hypothetical protein